MIELARAALVELGLCAPTGRLDCNVLVRSNVIVEAFVDAETFYQLKLSRNATVEREFRSMREAGAIFSGMLPEAFGLVESGPWRILVCAGVRHMILTPETSAKNAPLVRGFLADYFARAKAAARPSAGGVGARARIASYARELGDPTLEGEIARILEGPAGDRLDALPRIPQHSDFTRSNLGFTRDGIVIFDWEAFGESDLAPLDLCVLLTTLLGFRAERFEALLRTGRPTALDRLIEGFCALHGLARDEFAPMVPLCLIEFLHLKRQAQYGDSVRENVARLIAGLASRHMAKAA
jgi:hypothetical protein